jgi:hypothetical protein
LTGRGACGNKKDAACLRVCFENERENAVTIVRVGTTKKYSDGWDAAFGKRGGAKTAVKTKKSVSATVKSKKKAGAKRAKK